MSSFRRIYLDTNIFIALRETGGEIGLKLVEFLSHAHIGTVPFLATSELTLAELLTKPLALVRHDLIDQYDSWILNSGWLEVRQVDRAVLWNAAVLRSEHKGLKLPDAIHISTAIEMQCSHFLTNDLGIKGSYKAFANRYGLSGPPAPLEVIRPSLQTLDDVILHMKTLHP